MQNSFVETLIGAAVLVIAGAFFFYAYNRTDAGTVTGYQLIAKFDRIDGIGIGADVRMSGIKIGTVTGEELDQRPIARSSACRSAPTSRYRTTRRSGSRPSACSGALICRSRPAATTPRSPAAVNFR